MKLAWVLLACSAMAMAQARVPRPAPEFQIVEASGPGAKLSSYRGEVLLMAFVVTTARTARRPQRNFRN